MTIEKVGGESFEREVVGSTLPALVDFSAEWCAPCKRMEPIVEKIAAEFAGRIAVRAVDCDKDPELAEKYQIRSIPAFLIFKNGVLTERQNGAMSENDLRAVVEKHL